MSEAALSSPTMAPSATENTSLPSMNASIPQSSGWSMSVNLGTRAPALAYPNQLAVPHFPLAIAQRQDWLNDEERRAYMEATVEQDIAWQIASNRRARKMSQQDLAKAIGTKQSAIARLEDPTYGRHSIAVLIKAAHAFDCALRVSLISYSRLAEEVADTSDEALYASPFAKERQLIDQQGS